MDDRVIAEQIDYYRQRAGEYDDFWARSGQYALPPDQLSAWRADAREAMEAVQAWAPGGDVLELACGTGLWTQALSATASSVHAVDAAPEMIALNVARHYRSGAPSGRVNYERADLFSWAPVRDSADGVFFGYWHSHVPDELLAAFWHTVGVALRPGGTVMLVDSAPRPDAEHDDDSAFAARHERRTLRDGRRYGVVKRYWSPERLQETLAALGWGARTRTTTHGMILLADVTRSR
ncbi:MAG: class I SAM-dependent methyltransferase [Humibacillus sp.]|nr:class I SAM-dependent methyltransferase [Humibacillus sp.]MDN5777687.1 class I SAM-dependent methyltransferase [Humibacillus sp.]